MGTMNTGLSDALFSKTQRRVLALLFGNSDRSYYANEIVRAAGAGVGAVQRELQGLAAAGLVTVSRLGNQKHYRANRDSPIFEELRSIVAKVIGPSGEGTRRRAGVLQRGRSVAGARPTALHEPPAHYAVGSRSAPVDVPRKKLAALCRRYGVKKLSLFGSAARGELAPDSDVDLMVEFESDSKISLWDMPGLQAEFSALFGTRRVDLVPPEVMKNPFRRKAILADLKVLYEA